MPGQPFLRRESIQVPKRDNRRAFNYDGARGLLVLLLLLPLPRTRMPATEQVVNKAVSDLPLGCGGSFKEQARCIGIRTYVRTRSGAPTDGLPMNGKKDRFKEVLIEIFIRSLSTRPGPRRTDSLHRDTPTEKPHGVTLLFIHAV